MIMTIVLSFQRGLPLSPLLFFSRKSKARCGMEVD